jgi:ribosomal protein S12 methylthiotransferase
LPDPVPAEVSGDRMARFMALQSEISASKLQARIGDELQVLVDTVHEDGTALARGAGDAPEVDGLVRIQGAEALAPGEFAWVEIHGATEHDLLASPLT